MSAAIDRRNRAIQEIYADVPASVDDWSDDDYARVLQRMQDAASLGRTDRWRAACGFAAREISQGSPRSWAVLQGSVAMSWAAT